MTIEDIDISTPEFKHALDLVTFTRNSIFLTGKAGTGKSTFLKYVCATTKKKHVVLAPTGIAAINAGGATLHSFFKLPFHPLVPDDSRFSSPTKLRAFLRYNKMHCKLIKELELIIIDEISMVRADIIDFIDRILRVYSGNMREPFGGKQMLLVGDVFQLEPVVTRDEGEILRHFWETPFFFSARVFSQMRLVSIELSKVYRQSDRAFITVLDHIRTNSASALDLQLINTACRQQDSPIAPDETENNECVTDDGPESFDEMESMEEVVEKELVITLATRRDTVDSINSSRLSRLPGETCTFIGEVKGDFPESMMPTPKELDLKVGAQVIFVKNDMDKRWVNGTLGVITAIDMDGKYLYITTDTGEEFDVEKEQWANVRYTYNEQEKKIEEEELGVYVQFPVRLAWAITIHKSQGLTFNHVNIDMTGGAFTGGQSYVALSRCRSLEGLSLTKKIERRDVFVNPAIVAFARQFNDQQAVELALKQASADIAYKDAVDSFDKADFDAFLTHFFKAIHLRYDIEKPLIKRFIRRKLGVVNTLKGKNDDLKFQIKQLKQELDTKQEQLNKCAEEYYSLGENCLEMDEPEAAIANFNKALNLNPMYVDAYVARGMTESRCGKLNDAVGSFNKALSINPIHFKAIYQRGKAFLALGNLDAAAADADKATSLKEDNIPAHELFADILTRQEKLMEASIHYAIVEQLKAKKKRKKKG